MASRPKRRIVIIRPEGVSREEVEKDLREFDMDDVDIVVDKREPIRGDHPGPQNVFNSQQINIGFWSSSRVPQSIQSLQGSLQHVDGQNVKSTPNLNFGEAPLNVDSDKKASTNGNNVDVQGNVKRAATAGDTDGLETVEYADICLPPQKPLVREDTCLVKKRLYLVCCPAAISQKTLTNALCRFENLISAYIIPGGVFGYAKYGNLKSAERARAVLHGHIFEGNVLHIYDSNPQRSPGMEAGPSSV